jgi:undecaprenyl-diphosphatase
MNGFQAILLGIVQGLTEFLPISSSGHLILVPWIGDFTYLQDHERFNKTFDVALHLGTLIAVVGYFRTEVKELVVGFIRLVRNRQVRDEGDKLTLLIVVATIPAVIVGGLGQNWIDDNLGDPWQIAILLIVFGLVLGWADRRPATRTMGDMSTADAVKIGIAQAVALAPGTSRSGITITVGRFLNLDRDSAARFSFLLLVPATAGAVVLKGAGVIKDGLPDGAAGPMVLGIIASAVTGYLAIAWMLRYVRTHSYDIFVVYRVIVGILVLLVIATGVKDATF